MISKELEEFEYKMERSLETLEEEYNTIRVGRANPHLLDRLTVEYYGIPTPLQQVANISVPEARVLLIQPWESNMVKPIEKAINMSDIGINPNNDGRVIRLNFPEMTEEKRRDTAKDVKKRGEANKVAIRNVRRDGMDAIKKLRKDSVITEDDQKNLEEELQKMTDDYIKQVDAAVDAKIAEVMQV